MSSPTRSFRAQLTSLHREIFRRNQARIRTAVEGDSAELRRYEQRYRGSMRAPRAVLSFDQLLTRFRRADVIYLGDYHTLPQAQRSMLRVLRAAVPGPRTLVVAVEFVEGRHQDALDGFLAGRVSERSFLRRIEYRKHWPYGDFAGLREICAFAREHDLPMLAIDRDARRGATLKSRDAYAARRIAQTLKREQDAQVFCLIGELHLAPAHLPAEVRRQHGHPLRQLTLHQNPDRVYWALEAAGIEHDAEIVEITRDRLALNVVPPIVCQHSFLRWLDDDDTYHEESMLREAFRQQVRLIARLLALDLDAEHVLEPAQIETFRDLTFLERLERSGDFTRHELRSLRQQILNSESYYIPRARLVYLGTPSVNHSSEEAAHFLRDVVAGEARPRHAVEAFYDRAVNEALAFFCSKLVNHKRKAVHAASFRRTLRDARAAGARRRAVPSPFEVELARRICEHKRLERGVRKVDANLIYSGPPRLLDSAAHALGYMLGDRLYYAVVGDSLDIKVVREVFCDPLDRRGAAISTYFALATRVAGVRVPRRV